MNLFNQNRPIPVIPASHNLLAALAAFGFAAAIITGQSIAMAETVTFEADVITAPVPSRPLYCRDDGQGEGDKNCEFSGPRVLSRAVAENLANNAKCATTWISPFKSGWRAFCGDAKGKQTRELLSR